MAHGLPLARDASQSGPGETPSDVAFARQESPKEPARKFEFARAKEWCVFETAGQADDSCSHNFMSNNAASALAASTTTGDVVRATATATSIVVVVVAENAEASTGIVVAENAEDLALA